jgi:REP element-mobilizing transposase RayT
MPRPRRIHVDGGIYHATLRGNHRQAIFNHDGERVLLNKIVARAIHKHAARIHAFCWMTNHLHLLVQVSDIPLGRLMHQVGCEYARAFQKNLATTGHLFENRYHSTLVDTDAYFLEAIRYVHQNPIRAGMVTTVGQYRWSSHAAYVGGGEPWVTTDMALDLLSPQRSRAVVLYRAFISELPPPDVAAELSRLESGTPKQTIPVLMKRLETRAEPSVSAIALDELMRTACRHFAVSLVELRSPARLSRLVSARAWVAQEAVRGGCATLADVARALRRDESTLRHLLKRGQR